MNRSFRYLLPSSLLSRKPMPPGATSNFQLSSGSLKRAPGSVNMRESACPGVSAMLVGGQRICCRPK